jgi:hypothetical protein
MKIVLDRRNCNCWQAACDSHFGSHFLGAEITPVDCVIEMSDDGKDELNFLILDRDGINKTLVVDEENRGDVYNSWNEVWEKQQQKPE